MKLASSRKFRGVIATVTLVSALFAQPASAGWWLPAISVATTAASVVCAPVNPPLAACGGVAQIVGLVATAAGWDPGVPAILQPNSPIPPAYSPALKAAALSHTYPLLTLPGNQYDPLYTQINNAITAINTRNPVACRNAFLQARVAYDALALVGVQSCPMTQADLTSAQASVGSSGLPTSEVNYLTSAGWSASDITALRNYVATTTVNLAVPSVSFGDLFQTSGDLIGVAAPAVSPWAIAALMASLLAAGGILVTRRRRVA